METLLDILGPTLGILLTILVPAGIAALVKLFQKAGIDIEARHREALQSALQNAALIALSRATGKGVVPSAAIEYVKQNVPDAVSKFGLSDDRIGQLIEPKLVQKEIEANAAAASEIIIQSPTIPTSPETLDKMNLFAQQAIKKA